MTTRSPIYLIDGSGYIFRAYYAIRSLSTSKGLPTNAVYGFTQMLLKLLKDKNPEYLVMVFDSKAPSFRKKEYAAYKANRELPPEDLVPQFDYIKKVTRALNVMLLEVPGFEADDIIATLAKKVVTDRPIIIVTGDKDLMQLVDDRITLWDPMKDKATDVPGVLEKFGVKPNRVIDVLGLAGDTSDNVPGVPGIGPKTATQLIHEFGSIDGVYKNLDKIKGKKQEALRENKEQAFLSKKLVTLSEEVPLDVTLEQIVCKPANDEECRSLFEELEFHRLLEAMGKAAAPKETLSRAGYELVQTPEAFEKFLSKLKKAKLFSLDTETTSLKISQCRLVGLAFALEPGEAYYLPVGHETSEPQLDLNATLAALKPILEDPNRPKIAQHFKYDAGVLKNCGIEVQGLLCDTLLASYILDPAESHKLDFLSLKYLKHKTISYEEVTKQISTSDFSHVPLQQAKDYSAEDADVTLQLGEIFLKRLKEEKLLNLLQELEQPLSRVLLKMETAGVQIDTAFLKRLQKEFAERMAQIEKRIYQSAGEEFNIQSPKQLGVILFEKLNLSVVKKTKTGYSTDVEVLTILSKEHDLPRLILEFRSLAKLKSTYVDALLTQVDPKTGRVHTNYNQTIAETGRLSSTDPNLQNIPIRSEDGVKIRHAFVAEEGFQILSADYSQIELKVLAHFSEDPALLKAFAKNLDVHRLTAAGVFGVKEDQITIAMRASGKTLNFAVVYGQTPFGLSAQLGVTQKEAKEYIENYFTKYQGVKKFRDHILSEARKTGEVRTLMGRRRFVPDINSKNFGVRMLSERIAFNTVIQGTAADIIKKAMIDLDHEITQKKFASRMLMQVHDELVFEVKKSELPAMKNLIKEKMEGVVDFKVPLTVEIGEGANWAEAH